MNKQTPTMTPDEVYQAHRRARATPGSSLGYVTSASLPTIGKVAGETEGEFKERMRKARALERDYNRTHDSFNHVHIPSMDEQ